ncbi:hypothetical protein ACN47E_003177 [Coniothyrium glycines]
MTRSSNSALRLAQRRAAPLKYVFCVIVRPRQPGAKNWIQPRRQECPRCAHKTEDTYKRICYDGPEPPSSSEGQICEPNL